MEASTIVLLTLAAALVLFLTPKVPFVVTSIAISSFLYFAGIASPTEVLAGFNSTATWATIGMCMMGAGFFQTGVATWLGHRLFKLTKGSQKRATVMLYCVGCAMTTCVNAMATLLMLIPMVDGMILASKGSLKRSHCWLPLANGCLMGCTVNLMGATNILAASAMYQEFTGADHGFSFFAPAPLAIIGIIIGLIYYLTIGMKMMDKVFTFPPVPIEVDSNVNTDENAPLTGKAKLCLLIFAATIVVLVFNKWNMGLVTFTAAALMIITGCCTSKQAINNVKWETIILMACMIGFAGVISSSGAGLAIGNFVMNTANRFGFGTLAICFTVALLGQVISNFMSNNAAITITVPIALSIATVSGINPYLLTMITSYHVNASILTPMCNPMMNLTVQAGYRFSDYFRANWPISICNIVLTVFTAYIIWA